MPEQYTLAGINCAPQPTDRLFFAIFPDRYNATRIAQLGQQLRDEHELRGKPLAEHRLHITLQYLGDHVSLPQELVTAAIKAAATIDMPAFDITFDHVLSFSGKSHNRPLVLCGNQGVIALAALQQQLGNAMQRLGLSQWVTSIFTPHLTLLYDDHCIATQSVNKISWLAQEFVLVHSLLGRSQYIPIAQWQLHA